MTKDDVIRMAREAGWEMGDDLSDGFGVRLERFAALVAAAEREAGAKVAPMTLRQYAAITLRVPDSGTDWLDEMIRNSLRNDLAATALPGILYMVAQDVELYAASSPKGCSQEAYDLADAMLDKGAV